MRPWQQQWVSLVESACRTLRMQVCGVRSVCRVCVFVVSFIFLSRSRFQDGAGERLQGPPSRTKAPGPHAAECFLRRLRRWRWWEAWLWLWKRPGATWTSCASPRRAGMLRSVRPSRPAVPCPSVRCVTHSPAHQVDAVTVLRKARHPTAFFSFCASARESHDQVRDILVSDSRLAAQRSALALPLVCYS